MRSHQSSALGLGDFSAQRRESLTQIHRLPGAMSCLLRCEGLLHPCVVIGPSLEYSYVMEFLMWCLCDASHWFHSSSLLPQTSSGRFLWRLLSALTSLAFSHLAGNRWVWHGESAPTVLFPWSVSCDVTLLRLHMKLKCHWNLTQQKNRILLSHHSLWIDAPKSSGLFPRKFPVTVFSFKLFLLVLSSTSILVFPPWCFVQRCLTSFLGCFFF